MRESQYKAVRRIADRVTGFCYALTYPARGRHFPPILINALPKSGSTYISRTLRRALQAGPRNLAAHGFHSTGAVDIPELELAAKGNCVCHQHLPAEPHIVCALAAKLPRLILNLRDPRAALVSWTHYVNQFRDEHSYLLALQEAEQPLPERYFDLPISDQISWQVDRHLPHTIGWIAKWLQVVDQPQSGLDIMVTEYADMVRDTPAFFARILDFYQIEAQPDWLKLRQPKPGSLKFRKGSVSAWRSEIPPDALARATASMPPEWRDRFGWE